MSPSSKLSEVRVLRTPLKLQLVSRQEGQYCWDVQPLPLSFSQISQFLKKFSKKTVESEGMMWTFRGVIHPTSTCVEDPVCSMNNEQQLYDLCLSYSPVLSILIPPDHVISRIIISNSCKKILKL